jgi:hypothetical protein
VFRSALRATGASIVEVLMVVLLQIRFDACSASRPDASLGHDRFREAGFRNDCGENESGYI